MCVFAWMWVCISVSVCMCVSVYVCMQCACVFSTWWMCWTVSQAAHQHDLDIQLSLGLPFPSWNSHQLFHEDATCHCLLRTLLSTYVALPGVFVQPLCRTLAQMRGGWPHPADLAPTVPPEMIHFPSLQLHMKLANKQDKVCAPSGESRWVGTALHGLEHFLVGHGAFYDCVTYTGWKTGVGRRDKKTWVRGAVYSIGWGDSVYPRPMSIHVLALTASLSWSRLELGLLYTLNFGSTQLFNDCPLVSLGDRVNPPGATVEGGTDHSSVMYNKTFGTKNTWKTVIPNVTETPLLCWELHL
jgi:hypothetical protein